MRVLRRPRARRWRSWTRRARPRAARARARRRWRAHHGARTGARRDLGPRRRCVSGDRPRRRGLRLDVSARRAAAQWRGSRCAGWCAAASEAPSCELRFIYPLFIEERSNPAFRARARGAAAAPRLNACAPPRRRTRARAASLQRRRCSSKVDDNRKSNGGSRRSTSRAGPSCRGRSSMLKRARCPTRPCAPTAPLDSALETSASRRHRRGRADREGAAARRSSSCQAVGVDAPRGLRRVARRRRACAGAPARARSPSTPRASPGVSWRPRVRRARASAYTALRTRVADSPAAYGDEDQQDPANGRRGARHLPLDARADMGGAPASAYLDVILRLVIDDTSRAVAAYHVSGEYSPRRGRRRGAARSTSTTRWRARGRLVLPPRGRHAPHVLREARRASTRVRILEHGDRGAHACDARAPRGALRPAVASRRLGRRARHRGRRGRRRRRDKRRCP